MAHDHTTHRHGHVPLVPLYDTLARIGGAPRLYDAVLKRAGLAAGTRVLDLGCGTGSLLLRAAAREPGIVGIGVDPDPRMLARATRKARRSRAALRWVEAGADAVGLPDDSADRVLSTLMLHHLGTDQQRAMFGEITRLLAPGGRLVLADLDGSPGRGLLGRLAGGRVHDRHPDGAPLPDRVAAAGFAVRSVDRVVLRAWGTTVVTAEPARR